MNTNTAFPKLRFRRSPLTPYEGYEDDEGAVLFTLPSLPPPLSSSSSSTSSSSFSSSSSSSSLLAVRSTTPLRFSIDFKDQLANKYRERRMLRKRKEIFLVLKTYCFRFITLRQNLYEIFRVQFLWKRLNMWRIIVRKELLLKKCIRRRWRKQRLITFRRWKHETKWLRRKEKILNTSFHILKKYSFKKIRLRLRWVQLAMNIIRLKYCIVIQKFIRKYCPRKINIETYKSMKYLKFVIMKSWLGLRLIQRRVKSEKRRLAYEMSTLETLLIKVDKSLDLVLADDYENGCPLQGAYLQDVRRYEQQQQQQQLRQRNSSIAQGKEKKMNRGGGGDVDANMLINPISNTILLTYSNIKSKLFSRKVETITEVAETWRLTEASETEEIKRYQTNQSNLKKITSTTTTNDVDMILFPTPEQVPAIAKVWTITSKALIVLKFRCRRVATYSVIKKFRFAAPPLYECRGCRSVFILKVLIAHHNKTCIILKKKLETGKNDFEQPQFACYKFARPLADLALKPFFQYLDKH